MLDGIFRNPTEIYFGPSCIKELGPKISHEGTRVLLVYGGDSAKQCGAYSDVVAALHQQGVPYYELAGVRPNPCADKVRHGVQLCKTYSVDLIIAVGGGSVIDTAKAIALGFYSQYADIFQLFDGAKLPERALPIGVVLTLPGSGSESSPDAVISFPENLEKRPITSPLIYPRFAFLNPCYTLGVSRELTMSGLWDAISHVLERYFTNETHVDCSSNLCEGLLRSLMDLAVKLLAEPNNYGYRAEAMWACKLAHDGTIGFGRKADWATHRIAHEIAALYETNHGYTLAAIYPAWIRLCGGTRPEFVERLSLRLFNKINLDPLRLAVDFKKFISLIGLPVGLERLPNFRVNEVHRIAQKVVSRQESLTVGHYCRINLADVERLLVCSLSDDDANV